MAAGRGTATLRENNYNQREQNSDSKNKKTKALFQGERTVRWICPLSDRRNTHFLVDSALLWRVVSFQKAVVWWVHRCRKVCWFVGLVCVFLGTIVYSKRTVRCVVTFIRYWKRWDVLENGEFTEECIGGWMRREKHRFSYLFKWRLLIYNLLVKYNTVSF